MKTRSLEDLLTERSRLEAELRAINAELAARTRWLAERMARSGGLTKSQAASTVNEMFPDAVRLAFSAGKAERNEDTRRFILAANAKNMTMGQVSKAAKSAINDGRGASISTISQALQGLKPIRRRVAKAIADIINYPATAKNWPGGILDDDE